MFARGNREMFGEQAMLIEGGGYTQQQAIDEVSILAQLYAETDAGLCQN
jgi:hypothetical protein